MKKLLPLLVAVSAVIVTATPSPAVELPSQASSTAEAHTHGPDGLELDRRGRSGAAAGYAADAYAPWDPADHDRILMTTDATDLTTLPSFHAVYIYPSDKPSRFTQFAAMFQADARDASSLLFQLYGRGIRFDERLSDGRVMLDITVFRSKYNSKQLATTRQFSLIAGELAGVPGLNNPNKKYFGWLDAGSQACGQGNLAQDTQRTPANQNEAKNLALVYRPYSASDPNGGFCRGRTLRHELGHTMGAVQAAAPNDFDGAHCSDDAQDTMCYAGQSSYDSGAPTFDHNNDDYWDPAANPQLGSAAKLAHWTVNLSKYVCPATGCGNPNTPEF